MSRLRFNEDIGPLSPFTVSLTAGFSASVAAAASHGFDTSRSRSQCNVLPKVWMILLVTEKFETVWTTALFIFLLHIKP